MCSVCLCVFVCVSVVGVCLCVYVCVCVFSCVFVVFVSVCVCLCGVGVGFTVSVWGFQGFGLVMFGAPCTALPRTAFPGTALPGTAVPLDRPSRDRPSRDRPKFRSFFPLPPQNSFFSSLATRQRHFHEVCYLCSRRMFSMIRNTTSCCLPTPTTSLGAPVWRVKHQDATMNHTSPTPPTQGSDCLRTGSSLLKLRAAQDILALGRTCVRAQASSLQLR